MVIDVKFKNIADGAKVSIDYFITSDNVKLNIEELVNAFNDYDEPILFINHLPAIFRELEQELANQNWTCKYCKDNGHGWRAWSHPLKIREYSCLVFGEKERRCLSLAFRSKSRKVKVYNAESWIKGGQLVTKQLNDEEFAFLNELSKDENLKPTPAAMAKEKIGKIKRKDAPNLEIFCCLVSGKRGGIIDTAYKGQHFDVAYHYDITSLYPYIVINCEFFPDINRAVFTEKEEVANHNSYAYWIQDKEDDGRWFCNVEAEIIPAGSIKMPLSLKNCIKEPMLEVFKEKDKLTKGSPQYNVTKLMLNSFIGTFIQRDYYDDYTPVPGVIVKTNQQPSYTQLYEIYEYIIEKARHVIMTHCHNALLLEARVLQINTDGYFTDVPVPYDRTRFLGSLRQEYVAHDLTIFACNQYTCKEETCIAGIPSEFYKEGQTKYKYYIIEANKDGVFFKERILTLGEPIYAEV